MVELDFEELFKTQMNGMKFNQCHPDMKLDWNWFLRSSIYLGPYVFYFGLLLNCIYYNTKNSDFFNAFRDSVPITFFTCMMCYMTILLTHRPTLRNLINCVKKDYEKSRGLDSRQKSIITDNALKGKLIMTFWYYLMINSVVIFVVKSVFLTMYHSIKLGELKLIPFYEMHYPFNFDKRREYNRWIYAGTFIGELYFASASVSLYFCAVPLGPIFMLHACGQLELIKIKFENLFENENVDEALNEIVISLQYVYSFVKETNKCFTFVYEVMLKQTMLLLPFTSYAMIKSISNGELTIEYTGVFIQALFTSSLPCYCGDLLMQKGDEVRLAAYNCGWERMYLSNARKTLLIILSRCLQPIAIETIFCIICLDTLTNVYRQAYTVFNLVTVMW